MPISAEADPLAILRGKRILVTGHTGFKGGWLSVWLRMLGAEVVGMSLPPPPGPSFCQATGLCDRIDSRFADIRDPRAFAAATDDLDAHLVVHMAAQSLVRPSYAEPVETFATNVVGTAVVLEAARRMPSLRAALVVTSDKCYENREQVWGYRENDRMGGSDPYSASKGCAELLTEAYRRSFFSVPDGPQLASVRAGNVVGGGDWSKDRLVPDFARAVQARTPLVVRNPASVRPWQHVLEPLHGYLLLSSALMREGAPFAGGWNFGPDADATVSVTAFLDHLGDAFGSRRPTVRYQDSGDGLHEAGTLRLDSTKARLRLGWRPRLSLAQAAAMTAESYLAAIDGAADAHDLAQGQIGRFLGAGQGSHADAEKQAYRVTM